MLSILMSLSISCHFPLATAKILARSWSDRSQSLVVLPQKDIRESFLDVITTSGP